jgi:3-methyladenine DNA glycosylase AlkC
MAEAFKHLLNPPLVRAAAEVLQRAADAQGLNFDAALFARLACEGLDTREMKARSDHIATALQACLPGDFDAACRLIEAALAPPPAEDVPATGDAARLAQGLQGWILWPAGEFVARQGMAQPERALRALHALTQRFTAEFAIRPFIVQHPALVLATLQRWCSDASPQVRRLVSEGSRPRLPWGLRLQALVRDPSPMLPLLQALQDDPSETVRRSVANHLNDIAKDHPGLLADWLETHLPDAPPARRALLRHASRTLIKQGDVRVLHAFGPGQPLRGTATLTVSPAALRLGGALDVCVTLQSGATKPQRLAVDYVLHHVKANGRTTPKVFKGWQLELAPRETRQLQRQHALRPISTRRYHSGLHGVTLQVNGQALAEAQFHLQVAA